MNLDKISCVFLAEGKRLEATFNALTGRVNHSEYESQPLLIDNIELSVVQLKILRETIKGDLDKKHCGAQVECRLMLETVTQVLEYQVALNEKHIKILHHVSEAESILSTISSADLIFNPREFSAIVRKIGIGQYIERRKNNVMAAHPS